MLHVLDHPCSNLRRRSIAPGLALLIGYLSVPTCVSDLSVSMISTMCWLGVCPSNKGHAWPHFLHCICVPSSNLLFTRYESMVRSAKSTSVPSLLRSRRSCLQMRLPHAGQCPYPHGTNPERKLPPKNCLASSENSPLDTYKPFLLALTTNVAYT